MKPARSSPDRNIGFSRWSVGAGIGATTRSRPPASPPAGGDRWTINKSGFSSGTYRDTDSITNGEVEAYKFTAQKTGRYTFQANAAAGSAIDTVMALYGSTGQQITYNDNSGGTKTSKITWDLVGGRVYTAALSNHTGSKNGKFNLSVAEPVRTASESTGLGRIYSAGDATLRGSTLTIHLFGQTKTDFDVTDHYVQVRLLDANGRAIHDGYWEMGFRTAGTLVPGSLTHRDQPWMVDLSSWNLTRVAQIEITVGYQ